MKEFKSKVGYEILTPVLTICIAAMLTPILSGAPIQAIVTVIAIVGSTLVFIIHMFYNTSYRITDKQLLIKCGFFSNAAVDVSQIKSITKSRTILASPAASLDRIELKYGKWDSLIISPNDKIGFVNELLKLNPNIQHNLK